MVPPTRSPLQKTTPWVLLLLAACSAEAPPTAISAPSGARGPATGLTTAADIRESVRQLTARGADNLEVSPGPLPGSQVMRIRAGYGEVLIAKTSPDGTVSTRCVDSAEGADAFLNSTTQSAPLKAAQ